MSESLQGQDETVWRRAVIVMLVQIEKHLAKIEKLDAKLVEIFSETSQVVKDAAGDEQEFDASQREPPKIYKKTRKESDYIG